eukprot:1157732-Pelagomonas_calceolata.AAC.9
MGVEVCFIVERMRLLGGPGWGSGRAIFLEDKTKRELNLVVHGIVNPFEILSQKDVLMRIQGLLGGWLTAQDSG